MTQTSLLSETELLHTRVISHKKDFDALFDGFNKMRAVSYVVSSDLLREFFDKRGYQEIEVVVGEDLKEPGLRQDLEQKGVETIDRLAWLMEERQLRIWVPKSTIHTKLYILEGAGTTRIIQTSANLTNTARKAARQMNYAWVLDLAHDRDLVSQAIADYETHRRPCSLFMGDLLELLKKERDLSRHEVIELWLHGDTTDLADSEAKRALQEITHQSLGSSGLGEEPIFSFHLPEAPTAKKRIERLIRPLNPTIVGNEVQLNRADFINYIHKDYLGVPIMQVDLEKSEVRLGINGSVRVCTEPLPSITEVNLALEHVESYLHAVQQGQTRDPLFVQRCMFESLLYVFSAPFFHEHMKIRQRIYGALGERRGPRALYIYGDSRNGKTTFLRFALKLITGQASDPWPGADFTTKKLPLALSTVFPLLFDDVTSSQRVALEKVFKSYWEVWWTSEFPCPQVILTSNVYNLPEWAKSRTNQVHFDVYFPPSADTRRMLAELFSRENYIFNWFSYLYLQNLTNYEPQSDDELEIAREVMKQLYSYAGRDIPRFFSEVPIEQIYDMGREKWLDLLNGLRKAGTRPDKGRILIDFSEDMTIREVKEYQGLLPQSIKSHPQGKTLIIESPDQFNIWLYQGQHNGHAGWINRLVSTFKRPKPG